MSLLVVMGSGETAPTMVKVHRQVIARTIEDAGPGPAVLLDTPFGFQMNADDLVARTRAYFAESVGTAVDVARWRRADASVVERETALALLHRAVWAFAGPGSPTYALRQWRGTAVPEALLDVAHRGGTLVFGSAAACTVGTHAIPVYEIYKVGEEPRWEPGLDLLGRLTGLRAVVIPHYDNAEGGGHDTRFCYLGEQRLSVLERELDDGVGVLGVDEHTALVLDLVAGTVQVLGNGTVTVRRRAGSTLLPAGTSMPLDRLDGLLRGERHGAHDADPTVGGASASTTPASGTASTTPACGTAPTTPATGAASPRPVTTPPRSSLRGDADAARARFEAALEARDVEGCVGAVLELEVAIHAWSADTLQSDDTDHARRVLRALVVRLGQLAKGGARDPREVVAPYVDLLLDLRGRARAGKDYAMSDLVREGLLAAGVEVRDTPDGVQWTVGPAG